MKKSIKKSNAVARLKLNLHLQTKRLFHPLISINSSQKGKVLSVKASKPNFVAFFVYFGNSLLD